MAATAAERTVDSRRDRRPDGPAGLIRDDVSGGRVGLHHAGNRVRSRDETWDLFVAK